MTSLCQSTQANPPGHSGGGLCSGVDADGTVSALPTGPRSAGGQPRPLAELQGQVQHGWSF